MQAALHCFFIGITRHLFTDPPPQKNVLGGLISFNIAITSGSSKSVFSQVECAAGQTDIVHVIIVAVLVVDVVIPGYGCGPGGLSVS